MQPASAALLITPNEAVLPDYTDALRRGWSADNVRGAEAAAEELAQIAHDPAAFLLTKADDRQAKGAAIKTPSGALVPRLPGIVRWIWNGAFCGSIGFRWQTASPSLPPYVLGHIGYAVVPWKRNHGCASRALGLMLEEARAEKLPYVELTTDPDNPASQKVILANGGIFIERFEKSPEYGSAISWRYRIML